MPHKVRILLLMMALSFSSAGFCQNGGSDGVAQPSQQTIATAKALLQASNNGSLNISQVSDLAYSLIYDASGAAGACNGLTACSPWKAAVASSQAQVQNGAPASSAGSTSAVEKAGIPALLGLALENGAITSNTTGNTLTLSTTLMALTGGFTGVEHAFCTQSLCRQLGGSAAFNVSSGSSSDPASEATRKNISQWQIKFAFVDTSEYSNTARNAFQTELAPALAREVVDRSSPALVEAGPVIDAIARVAGTGLIAGVVKNASGAATAEFASLTQDQQGQAATNLIQALAKDPGLRSAISNAAQDSRLRAAIEQEMSSSAAIAVAAQAYKAALAKAKPRWNGATTFSQQYPTATVTTSAGVKATQPTYLAPGLVLTFDPTGSAAKGTKVPLWLPSMTFNAGGSFYPNPLTAANESTFRGATSALQLQWAIHRSPFLTEPTDTGQITLSLNGNYSRLQENQHTSGKKADTAVGNLKLEIPLAGGVTFPLSMTVANATDQIKETYVRGNFGISFDLDKLQQLLKATK